MDVWIRWGVVLLVSHFPFPSTRLYTAPYPPPHPIPQAEVPLDWCGALLSNPGGKAHGLSQLPPELGEARLGQPESWEHVLFMARSLSGVIQQAVTHRFLELDSERKNRDGHARSRREAALLFWSQTWFQRTLIMHTSLIVIVYNIY